jgi:hypothetical protein
VGVRQGVHGDHEGAATPEAGRTGGAALCIWWTIIPSPDGEGPVEWCKPVPTAEAVSLASGYTELSLRTEPAHQEAFVALPNEGEVAHWNLACESLDAWTREQEQEHADKTFALTLGDLGLRITYLAARWAPGNPIATSPSRSSSSDDRSPQPGQALRRHHSCRCLPAVLSSPGSR